MKRVGAMAIGAVLVIGCARDYDYRLEKEIEHRHYTKRLNDNLSDPATKGKLEELQIYVRAPKNMTGPTQTFQMAAVEPGRFDAESSFIEPEKQSLHILARVKRTNPAAKKGAPKTEPPPRGKFADDVVELVKNVYGAELNPSQFKEEKRLNNTFRHATLDLQAKFVQIYLYGTEATPHQVALIFEYPKAERNSVDPKIGLCLESFAVGDRARRAFAGGEIEEEGGGEPGAEEGSQPVVF
jgi:hypothetical protein